MDENQKELEITKSFVLRNTIAADNDKPLVCIDGRYTNEQSDGAIRSPGGDFGTLMAIAATLLNSGINIKSEDMVRHYLHSVEKLRGELKGHYHSDTHSHEKGEIGCGHIAKASNPELSHLYEPLIADEVRSLYHAFDKHEDTEIEVLEGRHREQGALLIYGPQDESDPKFSVSSLDSKTGEQYFVVDVHRAERFIEAIVPILSEALGITLSASDVKENFMKQLSATASILAGNLMQYSVVFGEEGSPTIKAIGKVIPYKAS